MKKVEVAGMEIDVEKYPGLDHYFEFLDTVKVLIENDFDFQLVIEGKKKTGVGKSSLALLTAYYLDPNFDLYRQLTFDDLRMVLETFEEAKEGEVIVIDEGSAALNALDFMKKEVKAFSKVLDVIRQKRLVIIYVLPSVFYLTKSVRLNLGALVSIDRRGWAALYDRRELINAWAPYIETLSAPEFHRPRQPKPLFHFSWPPLNGQIYNEYKKLKTMFIENYIQREKLKAMGLPVDGERLYTVSEAAKIVGIGESTLRQWIREGVLTKGVIIQNKLPKYLLNETGLKTLFWLAKRSQRRTSSNNTVSHQAMSYSSPMSAQTTE